MKNKLINSNIIIGAILVIIVAGLFIIEIPFTVSTYAKVKPAKQWLLVRGRDGEIVSRLFNFENAINEEYKVNYIARGDQASFVFNQNILNRRAIEEGDTVGYYSSSETKARYAQLMGEMQEAEALLKAMEKGSKEAVVEEAQQKLNFVNAKAEKQKILLSRLDSLYSNNLVSAEEYELAKAEMNQLIYEIKINESQLEAVKTGVKPEEKQVVIQRVNRLRGELDITTEKLKASIVRSPITGRINKVYSPDTLFNVMDEHKFIILLPVELSDSYHFEQKVELSLDNLSDTKTLQFDFMNEVQVLNSRQVRIASAVVENNRGQLLSGTIVPCTLKGPNLPLKDYLWDFLN